MIYGDANCDGSVDIFDVTNIVSTIASGKYGNMKVTLPDVGVNNDTVKELDINSELVQKLYGYINNEIFNINYNPDTYL